MALISKAPTAVNKPQVVDRSMIESDPDTIEQSEQDTAIVETRRAIAVAPTKAVAQIASIKMQPVMEQLKNALKVNFDTLPHLQINQGNLLVKEGGVVLGDEAILELLSYQDNFAISPGEDGEDAKQALRYSDDGITCTTGEDVKEYLKALQDADFPKTQLKQRCVLVVNLISASKGDKVAQYFDNLYQIDLPPSSKAKFDSHRHQVSFKVSRGKLAVEDAPFMTLNVTIATRGDNKWTVGLFDTATAAQRGA